MKCKSEELRALAERLRQPEITDVDKALAKAANALEQVAAQ